MATIQPTATVDYTRSNKTISSFDHQRYTVFVPPGPHPSGGRPVFFETKFSGLNTSEPASELSGEYYPTVLGELAYALYQRGWVVVSVGATGKITDSVTTSLPHGLWYGIDQTPGSKWVDPDIFWGDFDMFCAIQHFTYNAKKYFANPHRIIVGSRSGGSYAACFLGFHDPKTMAYTSDDPISSFVDYTIIAVLAQQHVSLFWLSFDTSVITSILSAFPQQSNPDIRATSFANVNTGNIIEASMWYWALETQEKREWAAQRPMYFWSPTEDEPDHPDYTTINGSVPSSTNFAKPNTTLETSPNLVTGGHDPWQTQMTRLYQQAVDDELGTNWFARSAFLVHTNAYNDFPAYSSTSTINVSDGLGAEAAIDGVTWFNNIGWGNTGAIQSGVHGDGSNPSTINGHIWQFYMPEKNPTGFNEKVGGRISNSPVSNNINYLFADAGSDEVSSSVQYRKLFVKQVGDGQFENLKIELENLDGNNYIDFAVKYLSGDPTGFAQNAKTLPDELLETDFIGTTDNPLTGLTVSIKDEYIGIWLRQTLPPGAGSSEGSRVLLKVRANKLP